MPDAKSLLPGRAFRSEHAQLRPEPHSIASHGPAPMDPLQTTRMRNGVLYAAEWPCCHDPLRLSLGSEDPFSNHTRSARAVLQPRAPSAGASPARGEACAQRRLIACSVSHPRRTPCARARWSCALSPPCPTLCVCDSSFARRPDVRRTSQPCARVLPVGVGRARARPAHPDRTPHARHARRTPLIARLSSPASPVAPPYRAPPSHAAHRTPRTPRAIHDGTRSMTGL